MDERRTIAERSTRRAPRHDDAGSDSAALGIVVAVFASVGALLGRELALWAIMGLTHMGEVLAGLIGGVVLGLLGYFWIRFAAWITRNLLARKPAVETRNEAIAPPMSERPSSPADSLAWLHVVSGSSGRRVVHATADLGAQWLARGERVLVIDGGPRLRLHASFGARATLGLLDCLADGMPVLGVVQHGGVRGLYLLVHGTTPRGRVWSGLGQLLDDARPHFDRVLLTLDLGAPFAIGQALAGRYYEAWWADPDPERRAGARALSERLGIQFHGMHIQPFSAPVLEVLAARVEGLRPSGGPQPEPLSEEVSVAVPQPPKAEPSLPRILDCDLQVRERLRFLIWMRGLRVGDRSGTAFASSGREVPEARPLSGG
jgi:hypothetical protein